MSSCGMEGANQTLRKLCHLLLSWSIQCYRSAVNWELQRGHFSPWAVYVCEKKKGGGVKERGGEAGGAGKSIVDMLMLLTISTTIKMSWSSTSKTSALGPSHPIPLFHMTMTSSPTDLILNMRLQCFEKLVRTLSRAVIKARAQQTGLLCFIAKRKTMISNPLRNYYPLATLLPCTHPPADPFKQTHIESQLKVTVRDSWIGSQN